MKKKYMVLYKTDYDWYEDDDDDNYDDEEYDD